MIILLSKTTGYILHRSADIRRGTVRDIARNPFAHVVPLSRKLRLTTNCDYYRQIEFFHPICKIRIDIIPRQLSVMSLHYFRHALFLSESHAN